MWSCNYGHTEPGKTIERKRQGEKITCQFQSPMCERWMARKGGGEEAYTAIPFSNLSSVLAVIKLEHVTIGYYPGRTGTLDGGLVVERRSGVDEREECGEEGEEGRKAEHGSLSSSELRVRSGRSVKGIGRQKQNGKVRENERGVSAG